MKRFAAILQAAAIALAVGGVCLAAKEDLLKKAPDSLVKGWSVVKGSTVYGAGDGITSIYNGGYEAYIEAGVTEALRRMYEQKGVYVEVTVHRMKSAEAARKFLALQHRQVTGKTLPAGKSRFTGTVEGSTVGWTQDGVWLSSIVCADTSENTRKTAAAFLEALARR